MHKNFLSLRLNPQRKNRNWSGEIYILPISADDYKGLSYPTRRNVGQDLEKDPSEILVFQTLEKVG
ncbi:MAG: hypothetical protein ACO2PP_14025 [Thermocrinis sp.]|jgi:hypothetical protein|uniref:hypothetical protein n=1 Tax=Thermocrinis sp. TaxID=2024383 RepID=UPI003C00661F